MKPYVVEMMEYLWSSDEGKISREVWTHLGALAEKRGEKGRSRASVINELNALVENGILSFEEETGKGGYHRIYSPKMNREQFKAYIVKRTVDKLTEIFPGDDGIEGLANLASSITINNAGV